MQHEKEVHSPSVLGHVTNMNSIRKNKIADHRIITIGDSSHESKPYNNESCKHCGMQNGEEEPNEAKHENSRDLKRIKDRYMSSFTMHALNHIVEGSLPEKILWTLKLVIAIGVAVWLAWHFFYSYLNYEVSTIIKNVPKMSMKLPTLYLCNDKYGRVLNTYYSCKTGSKGYNNSACVEMRKDLPYWYSKGAEDCGNKENNHRFCSEKDPLLMNQCIVINPKHNQQRGSTDGMHKRLFILCENNNTADVDLPFPLHFWISPVEEIWRMSAGAYRARIDGPGKYEFSLEKTTTKRLPAPYSRCIEEGSPEAFEKNIFRGSYTREKCEHSCNIKGRYLKCGVAPYVVRNYVRDKDYLNHFLNESFDAETVYSCLRDSDGFEACAKTCYQPCVEERYRVNEISHPWTSSEVRHHQRHHQQHNHSFKSVSLTVYFREMMELEITETPSYDRVTLLANFGGMLGLMTGMSAISVLEILIWILLCIIIFAQYRLK